jgi:hypothetical protein
MLRLPDRAPEARGRCGFGLWLGRFQLLVSFHLGRHVLPRHVHLARRPTGIASTGHTARRGVAIAPQVEQASERCPGRATWIAAVPTAWIAAIWRTIRPLAPVDVAAARAARQAVLHAERQRTATTTADGTITARIAGRDSASTATHSRIADIRAGADTAAEAQYGGDQQQRGRIPIQHRLNPF